jgi:hypothetical protein
MFKLFLSAAATIAAVLISTGADAAPFTGGNLVVVREGTGSAALTNASTQVFLDEYTPAGVLVQSISLPTAVNGANQPLTHPGNGTSGGELTLSANGQYLVMAGYGVTTGTATVPQTSAATVNRIVARIAMNGTIDTTTRMDDAYSGVTGTNGDIRGAVSIDGTGFWTSGNAAGAVASAGIRYVPFGNTGGSTQLNSTVTNTRWIAQFGGDLYFSVGQATIGVYKITGLPTTTGQTANMLFAQTSPYGVAPVSATRIYVADETAVSSTGQGLFQWDFVNPNWNSTTYNTGISTGATIAGVRGVFVGTIGAAPTVFVTEGSTTSGNPGNRILKMDLTSPGTFTAVATAGTNQAFRGIVQIPAAAGVNDWALY